MSFLSNLIEYQAFASLWFWVLLLVLMLRLRANIYGVPSALIYDARSGDVAAQELCHKLFTRKSAALLAQPSWGALFVTALVFACFAGAFIAGFFYGVEFYQALVFLTAPFMLNILIDRLKIRRIMRRSQTRDALIKALFYHDLQLQIMHYALKFIAIFWGAMFLVTRSFL